MITVAKIPMVQKLGRVWCLLSFTAACILGAPVLHATAQSPARPGKSASAEDSKARDLFQAAQLQFEEQAYQSALNLFRKAYTKSKRPQLLYNIALTADRLGELDQALEAYQGYVRALPKGARAAEAGRRVASLKVQIARERKQREAAMQREAAARSQAQAATQRAEREAEASAEAKTALQRAELQAAAEREATARREAAVANEAAAQREAANQTASVPLQGSPVSPPPPVYKRWWLWAGVGAAVVAAGLTGWLATRDQGTRWESPADTKTRYVVRTNPPSAAMTMGGSVAVNP